MAERNGCVFASFAADTEPLAEYIGPSILPLYDRIFDGREIEVLGYQRQLIPANWKLMFENIKDPYHATLLHVFGLDAKKLTYKRGTTELSLLNGQAGTVVTDLLR